MDWKEISFGDVLYPFYQEVVSRYLLLARQIEIIAYYNPLDIEKDMKTSEKFTRST